MELERGARGQFDVVVDGRTVVSRKGGLLARLAGRPWPAAADVVAAVRRVVASRGEGAGGGTDQPRGT